MIVEFKFILGLLIICSFMMFCIYKSINDDKWRH
uniref:Uncharacterized protein n=1 Tax=Myoviridae sp. ctWb16 TaxID=2827690 RepID=A0A8S5T012_9CAUD|nr:MAG TPA: hypothetical protein [Myoviridae sp. ctWb16]